MRNLETQEQKRKNQKLVLEFLAKTSAAYQNFQVNEYSAQVWLTGLKGLNPKLVNLALNEHIQSSQFPPTVADIRKIATALLKNAKRKKKAIELSLTAQQASLPANQAQREKIKQIIQSTLRGAHATNRTV